jgi:hypothetical protein
MRPGPGKHLGHRVQAPPQPPAYENHIARSGPRIEPASRCDLGQALPATKHKPEQRVALGAQDLLAAGERLGISLLPSSRGTCCAGVIRLRANMAARGSLSFPMATA